MRYSTDTRTIRPGETYVAIRGVRHDGHTFVEEAIKRGARRVVVERPVVAAPDVTVVQVQNSVQYLAKEARKKLLAVGPSVVAITGSIGKTSTKNAITTVLRGRFSVLSTKGNLNTMLGISLTLLNSDYSRDTKVVLEMGACKPGDIAGLCRHFPPDIAVVTNVHGVHLETFGTIDDVASAKSEIVQALTPAGTACLNADDARVDAMAALSPGRTLRFGTGMVCDIRPCLIKRPIPLLGDHAIYLALAAFSVGHALGMPPEEINDRLAALRPAKGRLSRLPGVSGCSLIDDSYNASPASTRAALSVLQRQPGARRIACLGDMLELGAGSHAEHTKIIQAATEVADSVILVGEHMAAAAASLPGVDHGVVAVFADSNQAVAALSAGVPLRPEQGDVFLVKGSQGARMEHVCRALLREDVAPESVLCRQSESWRQI